MMFSYLSPAERYLTSHRALFDTVRLLVHKRIPVTRPLVLCHLRAHRGSYEYENVLLTCVGRVASLNREIHVAECSLLMPIVSCKSVGDMVFSLLLIENTTSEIVSVHAFYEKRNKNSICV
ncbi:hypothetical protein Tco_0953082 [Tanacetum coccineum]|uniref:Uncharacterized protein n=1 Tax=Tanacetum coccineum TaxID=301880 RepID=A0ABQ5DYV8_9ASTR